MARASSYDEWEDPGMAFSDDDLENYSMVEVGERRVAKLVEMARVMERRSGIPDVEKPSWLHETAGKLVDSATWILKVLELPGLARSEVLSLPSLGSKEGKRLTREAQMWSSADLGALRADGEAELRYVTTIGRRSEQRPMWGKRERRLSNRLANALLQDVGRIERQLSLWSSGSVASGEGEA